jgi:glycosyltransferase involved in cell wall biosynthesis
VLHLTTHLNIGGITTHIYYLCLGLKKIGLEPQVASAGGEMRESFEESQIKTHFIPITTKNELSPKVVWSYFKLKKLYPVEKWDLIHAHTRVAKWLAHFLSRSLKIPYVITSHGYYGQHRLGRRLFPCLGSHTLAISESVKEELMKLDLPSLKQISTIHFGLDTERFHPQAVSEAEKEGFKQKIGLKDAPILGIVARLSIEKGHLELLDILSHLNKKKKVQLLMVGEGKQKKAILEKIRALKLEEVVFMLPPKQDPRLIFSLIDVYVSFFAGAEGFGISLLEAMAMGKPVMISCQKGGMTDFIENNKNGIILTTNSKEQMVEKIENLLENEALRKRLSEAACQSVKERFSFEKMAEKVSKIYETVI